MVQEAETSCLKTSRLPLVTLSGLAAKSATDASKRADTKDTAIYGLSSIVGRFLNYLLVPLYTYKISAESGGYGIVTNLYAYTALLMALLTFGME